MTPITRDNIDALLDAGRLEIAMASGNWWRLRRNGATKRWVRDASRIRVPMKMSFRGTVAVTEMDFRHVVDGVVCLNPAHFRATGE